MEGRAVTVHDLEHARIALTAAAEVGRPVILLSAPAIAQAIGPLYFASLVRAARAEVPNAVSASVLDCHRAAGRALAAVRMGFDAIIYQGLDETVEKLSDIGDPFACQVLTERLQSLDMIDQSDPLNAVKAWLTKP